VKIGALVLAAGQSKRFGGDKRQATLPNGKLVIQQTLEKVTAVFDDVLVVLRAEDAELHERLKVLFPDLAFHNAPDSELGMGNSLASGIRQISDWDGVFVFLGDMPFVEVETLKSLVPTGTAVGNPNTLVPTGAAEGGEAEGSLRSQSSVNMRPKIIVPSYEGKPGHPVGFSSDFFEELKGISGDRGARAVIQRHEDRIVVLDVGDPGVLQDIDEKTDL